MNILDKIKAKKGIAKAVIYARFSSDNQRDESIDAQIRAIRDYAMKNDILIVGEYIDKAKSATTVNRPEFLKMISDSSQGEFDIVLVHKLDRFARNRQDSIGYRMQLKKHNVTLISILEYIDESPESIILESVLEAMAEYYSKNLAREVQKGLKENALKGIHTGGVPPFGYDVDKETRKLIINENEACAVRLIFKRFVEGRGYDLIIRELNSLGYKTKRGMAFGKNSLHSILRNEKYSGIYIYNKSSPKDMDGRRNTHKYKDDEDIIKIEDAVPALITKEVFAEVQTRMIRRKQSRASNKAKEVYLLSSKIFCGICGFPMSGNKKVSGRNKTPHVTYRCNGRKFKHICMNKEIRREYIEAYVLNKLADYVFNDNLISQLLNEYTNYQNSLNSDYVLQKSSIKKRLSEINKEISNLIDVIAKTGSQMFLARVTELEQEKEMLETSLNEILDKTDTDEINEEELILQFQRAKDMLRYGELTETKKIVQMFVDSVIVYEDRVEVIFNFHHYIMPDVLLQKIDILYSTNKMAENSEFTGVSTAFMNIKKISTLIGGYRGGDEGHRKNCTKMEKQR